MMYIFVAAQIHDVKSSEILKPLVSFKQCAAGVRTEVLQKGGWGEELRSGQSVIIKTHKE